MTENYDLIDLIKKFPVDKDTVIHDQYEKIRTAFHTFKELELTHNDILSCEYVCTKTVRFTVCIENDDLSERLLRKQLELESWMDTFDIHIEEGSEKGTRIITMSLLEEESEYYCG